jgi:sporulation protein YlmC with PRC-barrel domain
MNKFIAAAGLATVLATAGTAAFATDTTIQSDQVRANKIIGASVYDRENRDVASVKDLILDKSGRIADVVLSYGATAGIGGKYVAVGYDSLKFNNNRLTLDETKQQLDALPPFNLEDRTTGAGQASVPPTGGHATSNGTPQ